MEVPTLCLLMSCLFLSEAAAAVLSIHPDRSQFFRYEKISLNCGVTGNFSDWTLKRNTSSGSVDSCENGIGRQNSSSCIVRSVYSTDTGVYWCESRDGERSNVLNITVNTGVVILESPALPVTEGDGVTLHCSYRERYDLTSTPVFNATFYRNNVFLGVHREGKMVLSAVSKSNEGFYECEHLKTIKSPQSFLAVKVRAQPEDPVIPPAVNTLPRLLCTILLCALYVVITLLCIYMYRMLVRARANAKSRAADHPAEDRRVLFAAGTKRN